jgi:hypothetical protein
VKKNIQVFDNFLPEINQKSLYKEIVDNEKFPWYFSQNTSGFETPLKINNNLDISFFQYGFSHLVYTREDGPISPIYPLILPLLYQAGDVLGKIEIIRIRIGLINSLGHPGIIYPHVDYKEPHTTILYYLNDSDGETIFYNEKYSEQDIYNFSVFKKYMPKMGTAVFFNGLMYHSTSRPVETPARFTININVSKKI